MLSKITRPIMIVTLLIAAVVAVTAARMARHSRVDAATSAPQVASCPCTEKLCIPMCGQP